MNGTLEQKEVDLVKRYERALLNALSIFEAISGKTPGYTQYLVEGEMRQMAEGGGKMIRMTLEHS